MAGQAKSRTILRNCARFSGSIPPSPSLAFASSTGYYLHYCKNKPQPLRQQYDYGKNLFLGNLGLHQFVQGLKGFFQGFQLRFWHLAEDGAEVTLAVGQNLLNHLM